jgi:hypothetical protein
MAHISASMSYMSGGKETNEFQVTTNSLRRAFLVSTTFRKLALALHGGTANSLFGVA